MSAAIMLLADAIDRLAAAGCRLAEAVKDPVDDEGAELGQTLDG